MTRITYLHCDWKEHLEWKDVQSALDGVFDGVHAPQIMPVGLDWDRETIIISSVPVSAETAIRYFEEWDERAEEEEEPVFLEIEE